MQLKSLCLSLVLFTSSLQIIAQDNKAWLFRGIVYDQNFNPLRYTHVVSGNSKQGDVTDSLGIFEIYIRENDELTFYNIAFHTATVRVQKDQNSFRIHLKPKTYLIPEAKVFDWGNSYEDMLNEARRLGDHQKFGESIGLPVQDPDAKEFEKDEEVMKNPLFLIFNPVSAVYYNYSRYEKNKRKAYKLIENKDKIDLFNEIVSKESLADITGLSGEDLVDFIMYFNEKLRCDYSCDELKLYEEIYSLWSRYKELIGID